MKLNLSPDHLKRYKEIATLFWKYGRSDLARQMDLDGTMDSKDLEKSGAGKASPEQLADDLEAMGPTYVKLGQVLSGRPDLLPDPYLKSLARLQDKVKPFSFAEVEQIITTELGVRMSKAFSRFESEPNAAASLGQVHAAVLRDGRRVVVKVQRPNIRQQIVQDFEVLAEIAEFLDAHTQLGRRYRFLSILEEFRLTIQQELNYEREAQNLLSMRENLKEFELICIPEPILDYSTRCVLTMDHIQGRKITSLSPLALMELDGEVLAEELFRAYLKQVLVDGLFHADPHPGNVFLTDEGRVALIDLGMVGRTSPKMQENLLKILIALSEGNSDVIAEIVIRISQTTENFDQAEFSRRLGQLVALRKDEQLEQLGVGRSLLEVSANAAENGLYVPNELVLLGKTLLQLDEIGLILDQRFRPSESIRRNVADLMSRHMRKQLSQGSFFGSLLEMKEFVSGLPFRLNRIMDVIANKELEVQVKAMDVRMLVEGLQKVANRITAGLLLAALILGATDLMQIPSKTNLFGYPALAIVFFMAATGGSIWLLFSIFSHDHRTRKKPQL